ncbi:phd finger family protein [Neofusicoccum parvum]|uniref:Uncharacterized protein n=2 Tax=Neofusicoccum parvum TaxID=310453 RepID=R1GUR5_BOTPV|nr:hypothetical protein UCRNP2_1119 [Neofusicoccum parvum UCRNP2]GME24827.1 phd finger family protein [Neofusicoccum parvum]GME37519.1 phd finger family protein [Neofusicoccum parvum]
MHFYTFAFALLSAALAVKATPLASPDAAAPCNKDFSQEACGACHFFRQCLDSRTNAWIVPCKACDSTSWCDCTAPPGHNDPPFGEQL